MHKQGFRQGGILSNKGAFIAIVILILILFLIISINYCSLTETTETIVEFPKCGQGFATMDKPIKAYLNPLKSYTRILGGGEAKYVLSSDNTKFFICNEKPGINSEHIKEWWKMPAENYFVYPFGKDTIIFSWWQ
ncbi:MAG: hypothetical protein WC447_00345 [Candidatus Paceibacterota bacterium]|jgi:hypothetical protein